MVFSSPLFLFGFLPGAVAAYFLSPARAKNAVLLLASLLYYVVSAGVFIIILLGSILWNYLVAQRIATLAGTPRRWMLAAGIAGNLIPLLVFKYGGFSIMIANNFLGWTGGALLKVPAFFLPAGISFFTFQAISYLIDVHRRDVEACPSLVNYALYKAFFPQLVAGPIVRYHDLAREIQNRSHSLAGVESGLIRFGFGLGKKVLLADTLGRIADTIFNGAVTQLSTGTAWLGVLCYTFQIFYDFSGYSDMAIGLARVFGLASMPENFHQPYRATSITDFWRRWHLTLSSWFRDYLYIPLGGNRRGPARTVFNLGIVFFLCGLWHGAAYTFVIWGLYHGLLLILERFFIPGRQTGPDVRLRRIITFLLVMIGWVFFRAHSLGEALAFLRAMVGANPPASPLFPVGYFLTPNHACYLLAAMVVAFWPEQPTRFARLAPLRPYGALVVTALALIMQSPQSFNPFIYFQF
jgi:alginate O-acetyltransferase complex protein AlgI